MAAREPIDRVTIIDTEADRAVDVDNRAWVREPALNEDERLIYKRMGSNTIKAYIPLRFAPEWADRGCLLVASYEGNIRATRRISKASQIHRGGDPFWKLTCSPQSD